jgi:hypothetical protein
MMPASASARPSPALARPRAVIALTLLLCAQFVGVGGLLPYYAFARQDGVALCAFVVALVILAIATIGGVWRQRPWALWATLTLVSCKLTVDLFAWALALDRSPLILLSEAVNLGIIALAFQLAGRSSPQITPAQRGFYGCVLALAAFVAAWGLGAPQRVDSALPFLVPHLHARFLGAMYLSGAVFLALGIAAKDWSAVRVMTPMIAIWTGTLGLVSLLHLDQFGWQRAQTWIWFIAYSAYPLIAAWITWRQRGVAPIAGAHTLAPGLRGYLVTQGALATSLALGLLFAAPLFVRTWPWPIPLTLAHLYAAPFLSFGLGSLYAARQRDWAAVRIVVHGTLVFALGVLVVSILHRALFSFDRPAAWLWFGGFGLASLILGLYASLPALRGNRPTPAPLLHHPQASPKEHSPAPGA